jgi:hypothetical protein
MPVRQCQAATMHATERAFAIQAHLSACAQALTAHPSPWPVAFWTVAMIMGIMMTHRWACVLQVRSGLESFEKSGQKAE